MSALHSRNSEDIQWSHGLKLITPDPVSKIRFPSVLVFSAFDLFFIIAHYAVKCLTEGWDDFFLSCLFLYSPSPPPPMLFHTYQQLKSGNWVFLRRKCGYLLIAFQMKNLGEIAREILAIILNAQHWNKK